MSGAKTYFFPEPPPKGLPDFTFPRFNARCVDREDYVRERIAQAKYSAAMLAELYAAGEISKDQYERLRREQA